MDMVQAADAARAELLAHLRSSGYVLLPATRAATALGLDLPALELLRDSWEHLPRDTYLLDGGRYRARRHGCFVQTSATGELTPAPRRPHWQPTAYNALHGGLERWFEPLDPRVATSAAWLQLLRSLGEAFAALQPVSRWYIEAHQFRIDTADGIGRPTPEGAHRDGVDFVAVVLVDRHGVRGGETRVFDAHGSSGVRFTMEEPWSMLLLNDAQVVHETTPIQPRNGAGYRDTLVLTYRAGGFQAPGAAGG
jgi:hypothetical protein